MGQHRWIQNKSEEETRIGKQWCQQEKLTRKGQNKCEEVVVASIINQAIQGNIHQRVLFHLKALCDSSNDCSNVKLRRPFGTVPCCSKVEIKTETILSKLRHS